ncbi:Uncharacterised protein [Enterobacter cloacae]|nr:Uncharacterised protein [Enterobacter cloacae]
MVSTTTLAKAAAPRLASMLARLPKLTSATRMAMTKISSIDQRPTHSMKRYIMIRWRADIGWCRCTE